MKKTLSGLALLASVAATSLTFAATDQPYQPPAINYAEFYTNLNLSYLWIIDFDPFGSLVSESLHGPALGFYLGYQFNKWIALETGYKYNWILDTATVAGTTMTADIGSQQYVGVDAKLMIPISDTGFDIYGKVGPYAVVSGGCGDTGNDVCAAFAVFLAAGAEYRVNQNWGVNLEGFTYALLSGGIGAGGTYYF